MGEQRAASLKSATLILWIKILEFQKVVLIISSIFIILAMSSLVLMRYVLKINLYGIDEVIMVSAYWLYFIGSSYGTYERSHITADFVTSYVKNPRANFFITTIVSLITICISLVYTVWSVDFLVWGLENKASSSALGIPLVLTQIPITLSFFLMTFYFIANLLVDIKKFRNVKGAEL